VLLENTIKVVAKSSPFDLGALARKLQEFWTFEMRQNWCMRFRIIKRYLGAVLDLKT